MLKLDGFLQWVIYMLKIWVKSFKEDCIKDIGKVFRDRFEKSWLSDNFIQKVLEELDNVRVVKGTLVSDVYGKVPFNKLSDSCKMLMLVKKLNDVNVYASRCGNDCSKYLVELSKEKDITITLHGIMEFKEDFDGIFLDTGEKFSTKKEYVIGVCKLLGILR